MYLALYRRYRPAGFDKLIGQDHIVRILKNQIKEDKVGHAYLFCGTRGTGKTSAAKIFARAINCLSPNDGSPCGKCLACQSLQEGGNMDILEIDAASNNRVEEVRELREKVQYAPVSVRYKVYIIDEVHMLSDSAFNALLKTLEEPPAHAVFILATTEPQKLPATILSRCMRFDFKMVSEKALIKLVGGIFDEIKVKYENEALSLIAKAGEGSVRDCLSIADKCVSFCDGKLSYADVLEVLGGADKGKIVTLVCDIISGNIGGVLQGIHDVVSFGKSVSVLCKDINALFRDLCIIKSVDRANELLTYPEERYEELCRIAETADVKQLLRALELFSKLDQDLRHSLNPRLILEATALKCAKATNDLSYEGLIRRVNVLEAQLASIKANGVTATKESAPQTIAVTKPVDSKPKPKALEGAFSDLVKYLRKNESHLLFKAVQEVEGEVRSGVLYFKPQSKMANDLLSSESVIADYKKALVSLGYQMDIKVADGDFEVKDIVVESLQALSKDLHTDIDIK